ncbi:MAG: hypothetical protein EU549_01855 [Promethearchaeota archaeon]|nr:MAG: hypothetical protein EU549_01855 [Candidatus Lokiarchaeota archaeon]
MNETEENKEDTNNSEEEQKEKKKQKSKRQKNPPLSEDSPPTQFIQYMLTAIGFYDYLINRPFDLIFQDKMYMQYDAEIIDPLLTYNDAFKKTHEENEVDSLLNSLRETAIKRAETSGFTESMRKKSRKYTLPIYIGSIVVLGLIVALTFMGLIPEGLQLWIMIPIMVVACILPTVVNYLLQKKWLKFIEDNTQAFKSDNINEINKGIEFIQEIINIAREIMIENELDGRRFRMMIFNSDYKNLHILEERSQKGVDFYVAEFVTPVFENIEDSEDIKKPENNNSEELKE